MITAAEYNIPPHMWDIIPVASRSEMMAYVEVRGLMREYQWETDES